MHRFAASGTAYFRLQPSTCALSCTVADAARRNTSAGTAPLKFLNEFKVSDLDHRTEVTLDRRKLKEFAAVTFLYSVKLLDIADRV